jgi:glycosyltransferase involved in cell wall biosynthesis
VIPVVSVVIPFRDEERNISPLHEQLTAAPRPTGIPYEILLIDDGSIDATFARLSEVHARDTRARVIRFTAQFRTNGAFAAGLRPLRGRWIVTMDGDLQNDPAGHPQAGSRSRATTMSSAAGARIEKDDLLTRHVPSWWRTG